MKVLVAGSTGFLGKRVVKKLNERGISFDEASLSLGVDFRIREQVLEFFKRVKPEYVLNCASFVGGIQFGYQYPVELFQNNLQMNLNLLDACCQTRVKRLVNPISNCVYPAKATLFKEEEIWDGPMHESVMVYGFVRKSLLIGSWAYHHQYQMDIINIVLSNMYGPEDHFEEVRSHALGALIMKMVKAKEENLPEVVVWGTGKPVREWLYVDDGAEAMIRAIDMEPFEGVVNIGIGKGISIEDLAELIRNYVGYKGKLIFDYSKPDGAAYKTVDGTLSEKIMSWKPETSLNDGIKYTVEWYLQNRGNYGH